MTALAGIKGLVISNLNVDSRVKKALLDLINAIDSDLEVHGYQQSSDVDIAEVNLDKALVEVVEEKEEIEEALSAPVVKYEEDEPVDIGFTERSIGVDEDEDD